MPGFDGTGPMGMGSRTGGGFGYCPPGSGPAPGYYGSAGFFGVGRGGYPRGGGRGRAWGGGRGYRAYPPAYYGPAYVAGYPQTSPTEEVNYLKDNLSALEGQMEAVRNRINELESQEKKE
ncbi:DUF5320 domain-containing protein [candidate division KSB1 bacterium]